MNVLDWIKKQRFNFIVGVPCSELKETLKEIDYVPATREDEAIGIAVGAYLAGKKPLVFMQNSGLGMCGNAVLSLLKPYAIEITFLISQHNTAEHHKFTSNAVKKLLRAMDYSKYVLAQNEKIIFNPK